MKLSFLLVTSNFCGDHTETGVRTAYEALPGETVEHFAERLFTDGPVGLNYALRLPDVVIEIRRVIEAPVEDVLAAKKEEIPF